MSNLPPVPTPKAPAPKKSALGGRSVPQPAPPLGASKNLPKAPPPVETMAQPEPLSTGSQPQGKIPTPPAPKNKDKEPKPAKADKKPKPEAKPKGIPIPKIEAPKAISYYRSGNINWNFRTQPNFVPESFAKTRNKSQAWYYKVTTLAGIVLIGYTIYGCILGYEYYQLEQEKENTTKKLLLSRGKVQQAANEAKLLYSRIASTEKKVAYDAIRQPISSYIFQLASRLPEDYYIQSLSVESKDEIIDTDGKSISANAVREADKIASFANVVTLSGKIIGSGSKATESRLLDALKEVPGFRVSASRSQPGDRGVDITFEMKYETSFAFSKAPVELLTPRTFGTQSSASTP